MGAIRLIIKEDSYVDENIKHLTYKQLTENNKQNYKTINQSNLKWIKSWQDNPMEMMELVCKYLISNNKDSEYYTNALIEFPKFIDDIQKYLDIISLLYKDGYLEKYSIDYFNKEKYVFYLDLLYKNYTKPMDYKVTNNNFSEKFAVNYIKSAIKDHPILKDWIINETESQPEGQNQCPDWKITLTNPNGEIYKLWVEVKAVKSNETHTGLLSPVFNGATKSNTHVEQYTYLPIVFDTAENKWKINPCFFAITTFILYNVTTQDDQNIMLYYHILSSLLPLCIKYNIKKNKIIPAPKSDGKVCKNSSTYVAPIQTSKKLKSQFSDSYEFLMKLFKNEFIL